MRLTLLERVTDSNNVVLTAGTATSKALIKLYCKKALLTPATPPTGCQHNTWQTNVRAHRVEKTYAHVFMLTRMQSDSCTCPFECITSWATLLHVKLSCLAHTRERLVAMRQCTMSHSEIEFSTGFESCTMLSCWVKRCVMLKKAVVMSNGDILSGS